MTFRSRKSEPALLDAAPQIWRDPAEETLDLYPGLVVCDNRVTGSITLGKSRLPLWCFAYVDWPEWDAYATDGDGNGGPHYGVTKEALRAFVYNLFEMRGEFARLLLILADGERRDQGRIASKAWWEKRTNAGALRPSFADASPCWERSRSSGA